MKLTVPPLQITEDTSFDEEIDIFNRRPFGEALLNLIQNTDDELVIALDAPWGEGKTTFIKMWRGHLKQNNVPHIYFDAFENDYQSEPFLALSSQIYTLMDEHGDDKSKAEFKEKTANAVKAIARAGLRIGIRAATAGVLDDTILDGAGAGDEANDLIDTYIDERLTKAKADKDALDNFKKYLGELSEKLSEENHIVFIIDELDRCKPNFALSLLESIKHLFSVPKITFVLVMNLKQLEESVRFEYGNQVDAATYLQKFITLYTTFPKSNEFYPVQKAYFNSCIDKMNFSPIGRDQQEAISEFRRLVIHYNLSLRQIEKSLTNYAIIHNSSGGYLSHDYTIIAAFLSIIKVIDKELYSEIKHGSVGYKDLLKKANLPEAKSKNKNTKLAYTQTLLKYLVGTDQDRRDIHQGNPSLAFKFEEAQSSIESVSSRLDHFSKP